jgi:hypothetical protein
VFIIVGGSFLFHVVYLCFLKGSWKVFVVPVVEGLAVFYYGFLLSHFMEHLIQLDMSFVWLFDIDTTRSEFCLVVCH